MSNRSDRLELAKIAKICRTSICRVGCIFPFPHEETKAQLCHALAFYVDESQGLVLTSKHSVGPGPCWGILVFGDNREFPILRKALDASIKPIRFARRAAKLGDEIYLSYQQ
ncbi:hypothetical protein VTK73DRAFT_1302 [Phialemonium thermophilum]|uniref:Uncharacterized protein n=1 Tax=Phialemonium thermophilum TaxID=223376 RepID=A0ABR3XAU0_9PEZI